MKIEIEHVLSFTPPPGTGNAVAQLLLTPQSGPGQRVVNWSVEAAGIGNAGRFVDAYGNMVHLVNQARPDGVQTITAKGVVDTIDTHGVIGRPSGEPVPALYRRVTTLTKPTLALRGRPPDASRLDLLHTMMARVGEVLGKIEPTGQTQMQADGGQSQSQETDSKPLPPAADYAHAFIGAVRALDIPARFVTGYLLGGEDGQSGMHAWAEAFDDGLGWIGFDPLLQLCPTERHVRLAVGLDAYGTQAVRTVPAGDGVTTTGIRVARVAE